MKVFDFNILALLILAMPMGVAAQNLTAWVAIFAFLILIFKNRNSFPQSHTVARAAISSRPLLMATVFSLAYIGWLGLATWFNSKNPATAGDWVGALAGYAPWILLPFLSAKVATIPSFDITSKLQSAKRLLYQWVLPLWALLVLSQYIWGWGVSGDTLLANLERLDRFRPRGFYSHPLSLAYVALLLWPLSIAESLGEQSLQQGWKKLLTAFLPMLSTGSIIIVTASRTVQVTALLILGFMVLYKVLKKNRRSALTGVIAAAIFLAGIFVSTGTKWQETVSDQSSDVQSSYRDDRLAFWHAHWEMVKERPLLGHGWKLGTQYRSSYYERIGLADFSKKYEAHNLFLQVLANGGIVGLAIFLAWGASVWRASRGDLPFRLLLLGLAFASLTQNSLQDYEVRFVFTVLFVLSLYGQRRREQEADLDSGVSS